MACSTYDNSEDKYRHDRHYDCPGQAASGLLISSEESARTSVFKEPGSSTILEEASKLVDGPRQSDYGHPTEDFTRTAVFLTEVLRKKLTPEASISPLDVALMMVFLKLSRQINKPKRDNLVDACGYLRCYEKVEKDREKGNPPPPISKFGPNRFIAIPKDLHGIDPSQISLDGNFDPYYMSPTGELVYLKDLEKPPREK